MGNKKQKTSTGVKQENAPEAAMAGQIKNID